MSVQPAELIGDVPRITLVDANYLDNLPPPEEPKPDSKKMKKPKLSKAERKARKLAAQIEFKKLEIRDRLRRELELSKKSARRGQEEWKDMCREIKILEFREELMAWDKKTQYMLQNKDDKVEMLLDNVDQSQEMHRRHFARQLKIMDHIIGCYKTMLDSVRALYEAQAAELIEDFQEELNSKEDSQTRIKINCENIMHATNLVMKQQMVRDYKIFLQKRDNVVNSEIQRRYQLRDGIVARMKDLRQQLLSFVSSLQDASLDVHKYERIRHLMDRQRNFVIESQKLNEVEAAHTRYQTELQRELLRIEVEMQRKVNDLRLEYAYFMQLRKGIEHNMDIARQTTFEKLMILCHECYDMVKKFKKLDKSGELLLCLAATCRKLQTESEKVVPWGDFQEPMHIEKVVIEPDHKSCKAKGKGNDNESDSASDEYIKLRVLDLKAHFDLSEQELYEQMHIMRNFWRRQALVEAQNLLLQEEKQSLMKENQKYLDFIKSMNKTENVDVLLETIQVKGALPTSEHPCCAMKSFKLTSVSKTFLQDHK